MPLSGSGQFGRRGFIIESAPVHGNLEVCSIYADAQFCVGGKRDLHSQSQLMANTNHPTPSPVIVHCPNRYFPITAIASKVRAIKQTQKKIEQKTLALQLIGLYAVRAYSSMRFMICYQILRQTIQIYAQSELV